MSHFATTLSEVEDQVRIDVFNEDDSVWLRWHNVHVQYHGPVREVLLTPAIIDEIASLHADGMFPHQKAAKFALMVRTAVFRALCGVGAISPALLDDTKRRIAAICGVEPNSEEFEREFDAALKMLPCPLD